MKVNIPGKTSVERLTNFTKRIIAVPKDEIEREEEKWRKARSKRKRR